MRSNLASLVLLSFTTLAACYTATGPAPAPSPAPTTAPPATSPPGNTPIAYAECPRTDCGMAPKLPNRPCPDGHTIAGPTGRCLRQPSGTCGWEIVQCESEPAATAPACVASGCSGILCVAAGKEVMSTCEYQPKYACYKNARCEPQPGGACGWTKTAELDACLAAGGPKTP
jgi:hypothetical protein